MQKGIPTALLTAMLLPAVAAAGPAAKVTNGDNHGPGSLRAALASGATNIVIHPQVSTITVTETLQYTGVAPLSINGSGQTIDGAGLSDNAAPVFEVTQGADLSIRDLTFDAGGGNAQGPYDRLNQGGGKGIFVDVPETRSGVVSLELTNVTVRGTGNHGVHVSDCSLGDDCGGGGGGGGFGSPASIDVRLVGVLVEDTGNGKQDADGVRIDERADGGITFFASNSAFNDNGADGIELDEGNNGDVVINVSNSTFDFNGEYCVVGPFVPGDDCDDDGDPDVDDAFDIDEAGPGSLRGKVSNLTVINNFDEGLDFDEEDEGGVDLDVINVYSENNEDEGVKVSEEDDGNNVVRLRRVITDGDLEFEEEDGGIADITINASFVGDDMQIEADDGDDTTIDGYYKERGTTVVDDLDFEGNIVEL
jgi:hypothetical protein